MLHLSNSTFSRLLLFAHISSCRLILAFISGLKLTFLIVVSFLVFFFFISSLIPLVKISPSESRCIDPRQKYDGSCPSWIVIPLNIIFWFSFKEHKLLYFEVKFSSDRNTKKLKYTYNQKCGSQ